MFLLPRNIGIRFLCKRSQKIKNKIIILFYVIFTIYKNYCVGVPIPDCAAVMQYSGVQSFSPKDLGQRDNNTRTPYFHVNLETIFIISSSYENIYVFNLITFLLRIDLCQTKKQKQWNTSSPSHH